MDTILVMQKSPNGRAIDPFIRTLAPVARRLQSADLLQKYPEITRGLMTRTTGTIHGYETAYRCWPGPWTNSATPSP
jgi:hypothetical protein